MAKHKFVISKTKSKGDDKAFQLIKALITKKPNALIGLAVGKTTDKLHKLISSDVRKQPKRWAKISIFQIDENLGISPKSKNSFNNELKRELMPLFKILPKENVFLIDGKKNPTKTIDEAYKFIKTKKGFDLITLGIGPEYDPHIAYNTCGKSTINSKMRVVNLHPKISKKIYGNCKKGITLGIKDILKSKKVLLIAYGKDKAKSIELAFRKKINTKKISASALQKHKDLTVIIDYPIAKYLTSN